MMTPERYRKIVELYHAALEVEADQRAAFFDRVCTGDDALQQEVESLIASHEQASGFIAAPALAVAAELLAESEADQLIGRTIARYQVLSLIGVGGMGQVYLAEDKVLGRRVALKLLPEHCTDDRNQVQRFHREARAASALNHPNILTVHEVGQVDGREFIATEYVDGETLRECLKRAPLGVREALEIATQVGAALVAAHEAGIVHRDIKPENIMLRRDGYVKVLDFGIAKLVENLSGLATESKTLKKQTRMTSPGTVIGTVQYMSPEQARGLPVDWRTDVWSLGVVIYEMVAGRCPFAGETHSDAIVSILEREAAPLASQTPETPAELERIVTKALAKNQKERYQTVKDMASDLKQLSRRFEVEVDSLVSPDAGPTVARLRADAPADTEAHAAARTASSVEYLVTEITRHKRGAALVGLTLIVLLGVAVFGIYKSLSPPAPAAVPFQTTRLTKLTATGNVNDAAISPDGKYVAYVEEDLKGQSLWVKQVTTGSSVQINPTDAVSYEGLTFSNDSNYIYYVRDEKGVDLYMLYQVPSFGGHSKKLIERVDSAIVFSPDGQRFAFVRSSENLRESALVISNADGSGERALATRRFPDTFLISDKMRMAWSPDGKIIACPAHSHDENGFYFNVIGFRVEDGSTVLMSSKGWTWISQVTWLSSGRGLIMLAAEEGRARLGMQLWHLSYPGGEARRITNDLNGYLAVSASADSSDLVTVQRNQVSNIWISPRTDVRRARQISSGTDDGCRGLTWTPDGKILYQSDAGGSASIWIMNADGTSARQLTHEGSNTDPSISPAGRFIVFNSNRFGKQNIWRMDIDGGNPKQLTFGKRNLFPHLSPDERWVVYQSSDAGVSSLWKVPIEGGDPVHLNDTRSNFPVVSPDGKQVACFYWDQANPPHGVMIFPFAGGQPTKRFNIPEPPDAVALDWSLDGRSLLYIDSRLSNIWRQPIDGGEPEQLTNFPGDQVFNFDYSQDGKWLAASRGRVTSDVVLISGDVKP